MLSESRRLFVKLLAFGTAGATASHAFAAAGDGHAAGYDVASSSDFMPTVPRKTGDPVVFTASLDKGKIKATSGGWAREVTSRSLPIATDIAGAHLFLNEGGSREMHWHNSAEWAYVVDGHCQVTVVDPEGVAEVVNLGPGDLWYFPKGHSHAIQTLGSKPCHAILAFDDGLYSEHGTFGFSDWMSRYEPAQLSQALGVREDALARDPKAETYIMQGNVLALDGPEARMARPHGHEKSHRYGLMASSPKVRTEGGELYIASQKEFPISMHFTGMMLKLNAGAMHEPHWHPEANEWQYVLKGRVRMTLFASDKRMAVAELNVGDCAYIPRGCGHAIENIGSDGAELVGVLDSGHYGESRLSDWVSHAPRHLLANNMGIADSIVPTFGKARIIVPAKAG